MKNSNIAIIIINKDQIGIGNIKRCYHLSKILEKQFSVFPIFLGKKKKFINPFKKNIKRFKKINFNKIFLYLNENNIKKIIIDYYFFPKSILKKLKEKKIKIIKISDFHEKNDRKHYDLILNQYISNNKNPKNINAILLNPNIKNYTNLKKDKKITIFFGYESKLKKIINCINAIEKIDSLKSYKKILILYGNYKKKINLLNKFTHLNIKYNPLNYFEIICRSEIAFGEAGTSAIERDFLKIYSLNFVTNKNQSSTKSILKKSSYAYFNKNYFKNSLRYFEIEILNFLKKKTKKILSNNYKFSKQIDLLKLIEKI